MIIKRLNAMSDLGQKYAKISEYYKQIIFWFLGKYKLLRVKKKQNYIFCRIFLTFVFYL